MDLIRKIQSRSTHLAHPNWTPFCQQRLLTNQQLALPENRPIFVGENRTRPVWPIASDDKNRPISHDGRLYWALEIAQHCTNC